MYFCIILTCMFWRCIIHHIIISSSSTNVIIIITVTQYEATFSKHNPQGVSIAPRVCAYSDKPRRNNDNLFIFIIYYVTKKTFNNKYTNNALCMIIWIGSFTVNVHVWTLRCYALRYRLTRDWVNDLIFQSHGSHLLQHLLSLFLLLHSMDTEYKHLFQFYRTARHTKKVIKKQFSLTNNHKEIARNFFY